MSADSSTFTVTSRRYHALDRLRASAMLLGVVYHAILFRMFVAGGPPSFPPVADASTHFSDWVHSFRMPLFFAISGFFGRMMLEKYGPWNSLARRWRRIAIPLFIGLFTFSPLYIITRDLVAGPPPFMRGAGPPGMPAFGPGGPPPGVPDFGPGHPPGSPPGGAFPDPFRSSGTDNSQMIFGSSSRLFHLHHLWFLWYLLVFVTLAPAVTQALGWAFRARSEDKADRLSTTLIRWNVLPLLFGLLATPALLQVTSPFGWGLGLQAAIFRGFPDFMLHIDPDMFFFFLFYLWGWWLHRQRQALPDIGRFWWINITVGVAAFAGSTTLATLFRFQTDLPEQPTIRVVGFALYSLCSAFTAWGLIGLFLRHFDRPDRTWRYLADTALWVYLVHQPLVIIAIKLFQPAQLYWWAQALAVSASSVAAALVLYELIVRPTPLVRLFGPADHQRTPITGAETSDARGS
jgi:fucose 4-O-acetylase-like acetyltransferase